MPPVGNGTRTRSAPVQEADTMAPVVPALALLGPVSVPWREGTLTRAAELESLCAWVQANDPDSGDYHVLVDAVKRATLGAAREAALESAAGPVVEDLPQRAAARTGRRQPRRGGGASSTSRRPSTSSDRCPACSATCRAIWSRATPAPGVRAHLSKPRPERPGSCSRSRRTTMRTARGTYSIVTAERGSIVTAVRKASSASLREKLRVGASATSWPSRQGL